jgi:hypothetical protein
MISTTEIASHFHDIEGAVILVEHEHGKVTVKLDDSRLLFLHESVDDLVTFTYFLNRNLLIAHRAALTDIRKAVDAVMNTN